MKLDEIRDILTSSSPHDWNRCEGFPTYRDNLGPLTDDMPIESHHQVAAYKPDVRLTLAWGMNPPGDDNPHDPEAATWWTHSPAVRSGFSRPRGASSVRSPRPRPKWPTSSTSHGT